MTAGIRPQTQTRGTLLRLCLLEQDDKNQIFFSQLKAHCWHVYPCHLLQHLTYLNFPQSQSKGWRSRYSQAPAQSSCGRKGVWHSPTSDNRRYHLESFPQFWSRAKWPQAWGTPASSWQQASSPPSSPPIAKPNQQWLLQVSLSWSHSWVAGQGTWQSSYQQT